MQNASDFSGAGRYSIAFLCLARNCAHALPAFLDFLEQLEANGLPSVIVVGENGSTDDTRSRLLAAQRTHSLIAEDTTFMAGITSRLQRMAEGRTFLQGSLSRHRIDAQFICVADLDEVMTNPPSVEAVRQAISKLENRPDIFAVSATSRPTYYDLLAYEDGNQSFEFLGDEIRRRQRNPLGYVLFLKRKVYVNQRALTSDKEIICRSAFNGMCLYRADEYSLGSYTQGAAFHRCEHVTFNRQVSAATGKHMIVDPGLILTSPAEHTDQPLLSFVWHRTRKLLKRAAGQRRSFTPSLR